MLLYKYTTFEIALKILEHKKIRYTQPIAFNDPFEVFPVAENNIKEERLLSLLKSLMTESNLNLTYHRAISDIYKTLNESQKNIITHEHFKIMMDTIVKNELIKRGIGISELIQNKIIEENLFKPEKIFVEIQLILGGMIGIFSMTSLPDNILMWSHYADSHSGIILVLDSSHEYFKNLDKVSYSDLRPSIDVNLEKFTNEQSIRLANQIFYTKSKLWSNEEEYRDIKLLSDGKSTMMFDKNGYLIILFDLPKECIKGIIFGCKVVNDQKILFMNQAKHLGYELQFNTAIISSKEFNLEIEEIGNG